MACDNKRTKLVKMGVAVLSHLTGISVLFALYCLVFMSETAAQALLVGLNDHQMAGQIMLEIGLIFGVVSALWAFFFIVFRLFREHSKARKKRVLKLAKGTVMTETLIVLPVFFLLTFGLAQMGINSMAGLLTTLGTYEAARTVAVWGPEIGHNRSGTGTVDQTYAETMARTAGAGVVAPVVAATVGSQAQCNLPNSHPVSTALRGMTGVGVAATGAGEAQVWSLGQAFGSRPFALRAAPKYKIAFCSSHVDVDWGSVIKDPTDNSRNQIDVTYTYVHYNVFPFVGRIFSNGDGGKSHPYTDPTKVTAISRTYQLHQQISPNPEQPHMNVIESVISGIGSWRDG